MSIGGNPRSQDGSKEPEQTSPGYGEHLARVYDDGAGRDSRQGQIPSLGCTRPCTEDVWAVCIVSSR